MGDELVPVHTASVSHVDVTQPAPDVHCETSAVQIIDEKGRQLSERQSEHKSINVAGNKVIAVQVNEPETDTYYVYADQRDYAQTPYHRQQQVGGKPVYVQGATPPRPADAARMSAYRQRNNSNDYFEDNYVFGVTFTDQAIRNKFVQRVYTILSIQLLYTCGFIALCIFEEKMKYFVLTNFILLIVAAVMELLLYFVLVCCLPTRRIFPINFILLALFTVAFAYIMGAVSALYSTFIVLTSIGITAGVCLLISIIACQTSYDITSWGMYLCIIGLVVCIFGFIAMLVVFLTGSKIMFLIYAGLIALVFSLYLMYDTQMIMGGRRVELSPEEYIFGALCLYVDIMEIFWAILTLIGMSRS